MNRFEQLLPFLMGFIAGLCWATTYMLFKAGHATGWGLLIVALFLSIGGLLESRRR